MNWFGFFHCCGHTTTKKWTQLPPLPPKKLTNFQKRIKANLDAERLKHSEEMASRGNIMARNASQMIELAEKALAVVHAGICDARGGGGYGCMMFDCNEERTLEDSLLEN